MTNTLITDKGKTKLLQLAFINDNKDNAFNYLALGGANSSAVSSNDETKFSEVDGYNYTRAPLEAIIETDSSKQISLTGTFSSGNFQPTNGEVINEIAIIDSSGKSNDSTIFAILSIPEIKKTDELSIKFTILVEQS